jgi:hypothetical protein
VLESLLTSYVFCDLITHDHEKQQILDDTASSSPSSDVIAIAIAHGACVNMALPRVALASRRNSVEMLEAAGAFLVGAKVFEQPLGYWDCQPLKSIHAYGVDWSGAEGPLDLIDVDSLNYDEVIELLEQLLEAGADPYAVPPDHSPHENSLGAAADTQSQASDGGNDPHSLYSRLSASECGREFIRTHARYFKTHCHATS